MLIFERIREEQAKGLGLATAIKNGYQRAFSAIFDSNLTTILTAAILYFVASEDIKGFAIVLILGLSASMFTAIFVTRVILDFLVQKRLIKDRLMMLHIIRTAKIDWMGLRPVFFTHLRRARVRRSDGLPRSAAIRSTTSSSPAAPACRSTVKPDVTLTRQNVEDRMVEIGKKLGNRELENVSVYSVGSPRATAQGGERVYDQYEITTTATNKLRATVTPDPNGGPWTTAIRSRRRFSEAQKQSRGDMGKFEVAANGDKSFVLTTNRVNPPLVQDHPGQGLPRMARSRSRRSIRSSAMPSCRPSRDNCRFSRISSRRSPRPRRSPRRFSTPIRSCRTLSAASR